MRSPAKRKPTGCEPGLSRMSEGALSRSSPVNLHDFGVSQSITQTASTTVPANSSAVCGR